MATKNILVVDDAPIYTEEIRKILFNGGYQVITAVSGREALEITKLISIHLVFMDIVMPEMDGFAACRELTKNAATKHIPIIFVSAKSTAVDKVWAKLQGAKGYITKPYTAEQILECANNLIGEDLFNEDSMTHSAGVF
jgi:twitching motility two-component system response regulator PilH